MDLTTNRLQQLSFAFAQGTCLPDLEIAVLLKIATALNEERLAQQSQLGTWQKLDAVAAARLQQWNALRELNDVRAGFRG